MTAFVILHYRAIDTTRSCVKSIRALAGDKHIVIVEIGRASCRERV